MLRRLEWTVLRRLDGLLHGDYRTLFRGFGLDLADLREYQYHDDVRHIDWNVTARLQTPYVREYNEDRDVTAWFLLDVSPSVDFGSGDVRKRSVSIDFVTVLARILTRHGNRVGARALRRDDGHRRFRRAADAAMCCTSCTGCCSGRSKRSRRRPTSTNSSAPAFPAISRRSIVFVVSDFISTARLGRRRSPSSRSATKCSPCGCTIRWRTSCPISAC